VDDRIKHFYYLERKKGEKKERFAEYCGDGSQLDKIKDEYYSLFDTGEWLSDEDYEKAQIKYAEIIKKKSRILPDFYWGAINSKEVVFCLYGTVSEAFLQMNKCFSQMDSLKRRYSRDNYYLVSVGGNKIPYKKIEPLVRREIYSQSIKPEVLVELDKFLKNDEDEIINNLIKNILQKPISLNKRQLEI
jgi:hypothetical protein